MRNQYLTSEAVKLLTTAANDRDRIIIKGRTMGGQFIQTNRVSFGEMGNGREEALWEAALQELVDARLVEDNRGDDRVFYVTHRGFKFADHVDTGKDLE